MKKLFSTKYSDNGLSFALLVLRITLGALLIPHGYQKLVNFSSMSPQFIDPFHISKPVELGLVIFAELFCSVFIIMGVFTRLACIPIIITMIVALAIAHKWDIFGQGAPATLFLGGFIALLFAGPGKFSLDRLIGK